MPLHFTLFEIGLDLEIILVDRTWQISGVCLSRLNDKKHANFFSSFTLGESQLPCREVTLATLGGVARAEASSHLPSGPTILEANLSVLVQGSDILFVI